MTGVVPLPCLFCNDELQTWYIYEELRKMRCTNCDAVKLIDRPYAAEECLGCHIYVQEGLLTYGDISRCE